MSLFRQLWLAVITSTLIAFAGSLLVSMLTARDYLEQQLAIKNNDNASSLALSMSQLAKDPVTIELQVAAVFDSGQYAAVRVLDPEHRVMIEKTSPPEPGGVPHWFTHLFPIESRVGQAQVSAGWRQFGTVQLVSHSRFAYQELWRGGIKLVLWFLMGGIVLGLLGMQLLRRIKRPLDALVEQAQAISERRLVTIPEPRTLELKSVARAMNAMVERLTAIFAEEARRLDRVRREATQDNLTGLANRAYFMNQLEATLNDDAAPGGSLLILRLADLASINKHAGREVADEVIRRLGGTLAEAAANAPGAAAAHLNGADFALLLPGLPDPRSIAEELLGALRSLLAAGLIEGEQIGHIATALYRQGENIGSLMARLDAALASAEGQGGLGWAPAEPGNDHLAASTADWKTLLEGAIAAQRLSLTEFPVAGKDGRLLHLECSLRLQATENGEWLAAGSFMPMASRLAMTSELDLAAARLALERISAGSPAVAVNLSGESILLPDFRHRLRALIASHRELAPRLWLEVPEIGVFQHQEAFRAFCKLLHPLRCRLGIEHFGRQISEIGRLHDMGLHYLKVDGSFIRAIDRQDDYQAFLKGLCGIARNIGLIVIAEGVQSAAERAALEQLGFDGATGPAVHQG